MKYAIVPALLLLAAPVLAAQYPATMTDGNYSCDASYTLSGHMCVNDEPQTCFNSEGHVVPCNAGFFAPLPARPTTHGR